MKSFWKRCTLATATASLLVGGGMLTADRADALSLGAWQTYSENFDSLAVTGNNQTALPDGWWINEAGGDATYDATNSNAGNTYSYGDGSETDRALGSIGSNNVQPRYGVRFDIVNGPVAGQTTITELTIQYAVEQWRRGNSTDEKVDFQYKVVSGFLADTNAWLANNTGWTDVNALDLLPVSTSGSQGSTDGNDLANRTLVSAVLSGLNITPGQTLLFRWLDSNSGNNDYGLAIDDFSVTAVPTPALIPGMVGMGLGLWRKRKQKAQA